MIGPPTISARGVGIGKVLHEVSFVLDPGACLGVVGINGAGKSTLLALLAGVLLPDRGTVLGTAGAAYLPEGFPVDGGIPVREWLWMARHLPGWEPEAAESLLRRLELDPDTRAGRLSQGQRVRLGLILTLGRRVPVYLLDDPFLGLDPVARAVAEEWIARRSESASMVIAAQDLDAIERLSTHLLLLKGGRVRGLAAVEDWRVRFLAVRVRGATQALDAVRSRVLRRQARGEAQELILDDPDGEVRRILQTAGASVEPLPLRLDEIIAAMVAA